MKLLIAEDERDMNRLLTRKLMSEGYTVDGVFDGESALELLLQGSYDAAIIDVMMPKMNGFDLVHRMRIVGLNTPVLILTARDSVDDRVTGLELGADDYLLKPFSMEELVARIHAIIRRCRGGNDDELVVSDLVLNTRTRTVTRGGMPLDLSAKEFAVLSCLMENPGKVLSREQILDRAWSNDYSGGSNVVDVFIRYLRTKIDTNYEPKLLYTVRGVGYAIRDPGKDDEDQGK